MKRCRRCKIEKALDEFYRDRRASDGRSSLCKQCAYWNGRTSRRDLIAARIAAGEKECSRCKKVKPFDEFYEAKRPGYPDGHLYWCKECSAARHKEEYEANREAHLAYAAKWAKDNAERLNARRRAARAADPAKFRAARRKTRYGMDAAQFEALVAYQEDHCAICRQPFGPDRRRAVDHDHDTGAVRGLLCASCNNGLGRFGEDPERLHRAARYVQEPPMKHLALLDSGREENP